MSSKYNILAHSVLMKEHCDRQLVKCLSSLYPTLYYPFRGYTLKIIWSLDFLFPILSLNKAHIKNASHILQHSVPERAKCSLFCFFAVSAGPGCCSSRPHWRFTLFVLLVVLRIWTAGPLVLCSKSPHTHLPSNSLFLNYCTGTHSSKTRTGLCEGD